MSNQKLRIHKTQLDNLISNLRGEVGEVITSWVLMRYMMARERDLMSDDIAKDLSNQSLIFVGMLRDKLADEIVGRLSELAEAKIGRLTFRFASVKMSKLGDETEAYRKFIERNKFDEKRNSDISHKELPETWSDHKHISIRYRTILKGIGKAVRLMKAFDRIFLGPAAKYLWREMRKKRSDLIAPASAAYMILPYLRLSRETRGKIIMEEMAEGREVWSEMPTTINGQQTTIPVSKQWGAVLFADGMMMLDDYPLQSLDKINFPEPVTGEVESASAKRKPITSERKITAKYRVKESTGKRISFAPVRRQHYLGDGTMTSLVDISINLDDKTRLEFATLQVGDEKEFTFTASLLEGYEKLPDSAGDTPSSS
jgi:hypothetical protein